MKLISERNKLPIIKLWLLTNMWIVTPRNTPINCNSHYTMHILLKANSLTDIYNAYYVGYSKFFTSIPTMQSSQIYTKKSKQKGN